LILHRTLWIFHDDKVFLHIRRSAAAGKLSKQKAEILGRPRVSKLALKDSVFPAPEGLARGEAPPSDGGPYTELLRPLIGGGVGRKIWRVAVVGFEQPNLAVLKIRQ
jgi:hypothetical protein